MRRFVVLEHRWNGIHWDFMLEWGDVLRTWALEAPPDSARPVSAKPLADHRLRYLDYEGPISGDRGFVVAWDRGTYALVSEEPLALRVRLTGSRLDGQFEFAGEPDGERWRFRRLEP